MLSRREREALLLLAQGKTDREIAACLVISAHSVRNLHQRLYRKLEVTNRTQAAVYAVREGLV